MSLSESETRLEELEKRWMGKLGRGLTPREKFYLAFAESCAPPNQPLPARAPAEQDIAQMEALAREEQERIKRHVRPTAEKFKRQSKLKQ
jgi:hypothetical protein